MKLTRRNSIVAFATILIIVSFRSRRQLVQRDFPDRFQKDELLITPNLFPKNEIKIDRIYDNFLKAAAGGFEDNPVLLYQGIRTSPYKEQIKDYPTRLKQKPHGNNLVDIIESDATFKSYPDVGQLPTIDELGLNFLHEDIKEACICLGSFSSGEFLTKWLGRNALSNQEFWSATKFIPILHLISVLNTSITYADLDSYKIRGVDPQGIQRTFPLYDLVTDLVSYEEKIASSNALAAMFKRFSPQLKLENWVRSITGNKNLVFRGDYGQEPFFAQPQVIDPSTEKVLMMADSQPPNPHWTNNTLSACDLTRMISMLGWHNYIPQKSRLPGVKWKNLESVIRAMGADSARLTDLAIKELGLQNALDSVVILSKIGSGTTTLRNRTEAVYVALLQFVVHSPSELGTQPKLLTLSMALRAGRTLQPRNIDREVVELDARMATEVTKILHKALMSELA
ncbi:MAG: hypothetical protein DSM106950_45805 [Stigonema ocellatum SAG 48.90 = DSM 106950]|nr:hypothetical protein [Stigonema ocellatum SAG 48.90 = DSM 106950]